MRHLLSKLFTFLLISASAINLHAAEKLSWTPEAMMSTTVISDVQLSPDNESVLFVATKTEMVNDKKVYLSRIYKANAHNKESAAPFSAGEVSSARPRWSPNGKWIAFLSNNEGAKNLYLIRSDGGEAIPLTKGKKDVQTFSWSPDGQKIAFVMEDETENEKNQEKTSLAYVYKQKTSVNRLWLVEVFSSEPTPRSLTGDDYCVRGCCDFGTANTEFDWSPDSKEIIFGYSPSARHDDLFLDSSLAVVNTFSGSVIPWENKALFEAMPRFSPDGQRVAYVSADSSLRYALNYQLAIRTKEGKEQPTLANTFNEGVFLAGPSFLGWTRDGKNLLFFEPKGTKFHIELLPADGKPARELETKGFFFGVPTLSYDRTMLGFVVQSTATPPEAFVARLDNFEPIQVSTLNDALLSYPKTETDIVSWKSKDGLQIEGLLTYPIGYEKGKQYPLLLVIHGGPMAFFNETFLGSYTPYPLASFAQEGFFILRPNPRGSCGYGKSFRCANYKDLGGMDFVDLMSGVDALIAKGIVDRERLGVMGWSYGGYMTAWTITQTSRFKAASVGAGISNLVSMNGTSDLHRFFADYMGNCTENRKLYEDRSPINHISNVKTPCIIQHGSEDKRVPFSQGSELYHALERTGTQATLIIYPGMEHGLTDPEMQLDAMERNLAWFQEHLINP